jgi:hypothetical protein
MSHPHRSSFSRDEIATIKNLLVEIRSSDRDHQKMLRNKLRSIGFYITDYEDNQQGFTASDVDRLVANGAITVTSQ